MSETSNAPFASEDVGDLIDRLVRFAPELPPEEWRLLLAILDSAASHFKPASGSTPGQPSGAPEGKEEKEKKSPGEMTAEQLRNQLHKAYKPGKDPLRQTFQVTPPKVQPGPH